MSSLMPESEINNCAVSQKSCDNSSNISFFVDVKDNSSFSNSYVQSSPSISTNSSQYVPSFNQTTNINNNNDKVVNINTDFINKVASLDCTSYIELMKSLYSLANDEMSLDSVISFSNSSLNECLLKRISSSNTIRKEIEGMNDEQLKATILELLKSDSNFNDLSKDVSYSILEAIAGSNNVTVKDLFKDRTGLYAVFTTFDACYNIVKKINRSDDIFYLIKGNKFDLLDDNEKEFVDIIISSFATSKGVSVADFLVDSNKDFINSEFKNLGKTFEYMRTLSGTGETFSRDVLNSLFLS